MRDTARDTAAMRFGKVDVRYLGGVTLLASILMVTFSAVTGRGTDWWAAWGQWVGGIGSIAAAGAAVWIAVEGWRRSDAESREKAERDLASRFGAWIDREDLLAPKIMVVNTSPLPMYEVQLMFDFPDPGAVTASWDKGSPARKKWLIGISTVGPRPEPYVHLFATGHLMERLADLAEEHLGEEAFVRSVRPPGPKSLSSAGKNDIRNIVPFGWLEVYFSDSNGVRWTRTHEGKLKPYDGWP